MFSSPFPDVDIPDQSIYQYLFGGLTEADLDRTAVVDGVSGAETTYRQLVAQIDAVAGAVSAFGLGPHGIAAMLCPNIPAFAAVFHGLLRAGATVTTVNSLYTADELALQLQDAGATWLHTGDIATVRADGVVTIVDRLKELIKYKGYQIAPAELEALLLTHPGIADAAVIGTPDADGQEVPMAFVVRQPGEHGQALDDAAVIDFVAAKTAPFKKIRRVEFIEAVPKSSSGKIRRRLLKDG